MREMHDGLGGQLVSTLAMVERGRGDARAVAEALRVALDDMRVVIDSLDPGISDLGALLGAFRARIDPLLARRGVTLNWNVSRLRDTPPIGPERALHVLRILQEAVTNAVRHADAETISIAATCERAEASIVVEDDGSGFEPGDPQRGRGLENMKRRASALGAALETTSGSEGTRIALRLPLVSNAASSWEGHAPDESR